MKHQLDRKQLGALRKRLLRMHAELLDDLLLVEQAALGAPGRGREVQADQEVEWNRATDLALLEADDALVREVVDALERMQLGTYGCCEDCDAWIGRARLTALPYARRCIACERASEAA